jgi:hypothetical protein
MDERINFFFLHLVCLGYFNNGLAKCIILTTEHMHTRNSALIINIHWESDHILLEFYLCLMSGNEL